MNNGLYKAIGTDYMYNELIQGLNLGLPVISQMLFSKPPGLLGIGVENITTSVVILIVHKSILYTLLELKAYKGHDQHTKI